MYPVHYVTQNQALVVHWYFPFILMFYINSLPQCLRSREAHLQPEAVFLQGFRLGNTLLPLFETRFWQTTPSNSYDNDAFPEKENPRITDLTGPSWSINHCTALGTHLFPPSMLVK